jgi:hypothetical protein
MGRNSSQTITALPYQRNRLHPPRGAPSSFVLRTKLTVVILQTEKYDPVPWPRLLRVFKAKPPVSTTLAIQPSPVYIFDSHCAFQSKITRIGGWDST